MKSLWSSIHADTKIPDLQILRINSQIHAETLQILHKENIFKYELLREDTMKYTSGIKAGIYNWPDSNRVSNFLKFLDSRPPLKKLHLIFYDPGWDLEGFQKLCVKVREQVSIDVEIQQ